VGAWLNRGCVVAKTGASRDELLRLMDYRVRYLPIVDADGRLVDFAAFEKLCRIPVAEPDLAGRELEYVAECIASGWISSQGEYVRRFEAGFAELSGVEHALATSSGTTALHLALAALGVGPGDEVIVPDLTFIATANAVSYCGASVVLVDVDPLTWTMAPAAVEAALTPRTKAIVPVHLYGHPADMDPLRSLADRSGVFVVEDCAEALGARYRSRRVGSLSTLACFSFYGNKTLTTGEGGMLVGRDAALMERARMLRDHGMSKERRYYHSEIGFNYRLTNLQAAVGVAQLERIESIFARKAQIDRRYRDRLAGVAGLTLPPRAAWADPVCWLFTLLVDERASRRSRDELLAHLEAKQIGCRSVFHPLHEQPPYRRAGAFPVSERLSRTGLSLPSALTLADSAIDYVCEAIRDFL
jgi:perosamine synthetase